MAPLIPILLLCLQAVGVVAGGHHGHMHHHHVNHARAKNGSSAGDAADIVKQALAVLAHVNRERVEYPNFNKNEFQNTSSVLTKVSSAQPLDYSADALKNATLKARDSSEQTGNSAYTIPDKLAAAARTLAESTPQKPQGDHSQVATQMRAKYRTKGNDTNTPHQALIRPDGLYDYSPFGVSTAEYKTNGADGVTIEKRGTPTEYWMSTMQKNGASPFAPDSYKVWRNVMDYGAKGDGVADDTEAINKAISDGGRCGANCGSSTIYPAVIWFPAGTYLVSTSIIQYYNTQFLGDPLYVPTILAASSFVGLGVVTSDVYVGDEEEWYVNQNNFLRSIRNFKIDIRLTDPSAYVCAIHWQVAQGTSLENIEFYMLYNTDVPENTQQGIYMENGSGGYLADLTFVGGNFGAYFGNQQFTTSQLVFVQCNTALQVHWDWAWTMQDYVIESCQNGLTIVGGAGGPMSNGQGVGSVVLADAIIANTPNGIITSLYEENSTSFLIQNVGFFNVETAIQDSAKGQVLLAGGNEVLKDSWGFGMTVNNSTGAASFVNGQDIPAMNRTEELLGTDAYVKSNLYTRRRPKYDELTASQIMNVKALGAKGDGNTDDTIILNNILSQAANLSAVVYFPFGVYVIKDTLRVPVGSRIIGQAWSQIMATGAKFEDIEKPRVAVQVGQPGDTGIIEIQDMMFTVSGPTAGVILVEWNVYQSSKGSAAMWDSHIRIGGAIGSNLQKDDCPKQTGSVNPDCIAASLLLHLTPKSSAYMENIWVWVADHDLDVVTQDQIDVYSGRGILIESQLAWLYGTASEHSVLYQYQLSGAKNILMAMIQTESPYFQPVPPAPAPFTTGMFPNDPLFNDCKEDSFTCAISWGVRIIDSSSIYMLGSGLYSWFSDYSQDCLETENCQARVFEIEESYDIWVYNLCTKAIVEMVSPVKSVPTYAKDNMNGFLSSILAWLNGAEQTAGHRDFPGFSLYTTDSLEDMDLSASCITALAERIECDLYLRTFTEPSYHGSLNNDTLTDSICDTSCGVSLSKWFKSVSQNCATYNITGAVAPLLGGRLWAGYNETCLRDPDTDEYCNDVIENFTLVSSIDEMPESEMCSYCNVERLEMMRRSQYSFYNDYYKTELETVHDKCGLTGPTDIQPSPITLPEEDPADCFTTTYKTVDGDTCDSIAQANSMSSASIYMGNQDQIYACSKIPADMTLCLPLSCSDIYTLLPDDTCTTIETAASLESGDLRVYNPWISFACDNLHTASAIYGSTICLSPIGGEHNDTAGSDESSGTNPGFADGYVYEPTDPPANSTVAEGTTLNCGKWYEAAGNETCAAICIQSSITSPLFLEVNPSLDSAGCTDSVHAGWTYCVGPTYTWNVTTIDDGELRAEAVLLPS
ncbi:Pectin lyase fold/virulence factor [Penicillium griseofulvum]|uniref:Pectin lyase fold/virulence factor n=1 Tax=Penicillium patulum TaxID=5078 RepID=A0A135LCH5_PENPA|nr:Pectin lyase fold/virulence factor [Penicillium griseofulvum]KXG46668.1 Pectin lyase fold/virulence factor [Penicillium griseofulvum]